MNLIIDIGNTFVKLAVFEGDNIVELTQEEELSSKIINNLFFKYSINNGVFASVRESGIDEIVLKKYNFLKLTHLTPLPLQNYYKTPKTLGVDRIAAAVGAISCFGSTDLLIIDVGTCITYDFINAKKEY